MATKKGDGINLRMQGAIKYALEEVSKVRPLDPVTFVAEKLLEYDQRKQAELLLSQQPSTTIVEPTLNWMEKEWARGGIIEVSKMLALGTMPQDIDFSEFSDCPSVLADLAVALKGHEFEAGVEEVLSTMMRDDTSAPVLGQFAMMDAESEEPMLTATTLGEIFQNATTIVARRSYGSAVATHMIHGRLHYPHEVREYATDENLKQTFLSAFCVLDHSWFMENAADLLSAGDLTSNLNATVQQLTHGELEEFHKELTGFGGPFCEEQDVVDQLNEYFATELESYVYADRGEEIRWRAGAAEGDAEPRDWNAVSMRPTWKMPTDDEDEIEEFRSLASEFLFKVRREEGCENFSVSYGEEGSEIESLAVFNEAYLDANAVMDHVPNVDLPLREVLKIAVLDSMHVHGPEDQLDELRDSLAPIGAQFFINAPGGFTRETFAANAHKSDACIDVYSVYEPRSDSDTEAVVAALGPMVEASREDVGLIACATSSNEDLVVTRQVFASAESLLTHIDNVAEHVDAALAISDVVVHISAREDDIDILRDPMADFDPQYSRKDAGIRNSA